MLNQRLFQEAVTLHESGNHAEAKALYEKLQKTDAKNPHLWHFRGILAAEMGDVAGAIALIEKAIAYNPGIPEFHDSLVKNCLTLGDRKKAANAYNALGNAFQGKARYPEAIAAYDESLKLEPNDAGVLSNRAAAAAGTGKRDAALAGFRQIVVRLRGKARTVNDLLSLGNAYQGLGQLDKALATFQKAIAFDPHCAPAHFNAASLLLLNGEFAPGWAAWEHRWDAASAYVEKARCGFAQPMWTAQTPEELGGPLLVVGEMGYGDSFHFARYVPLLAEKGYDILFEVQPAAVSLLARSFPQPNIRVIPRKYYRWDRWRLGWLAKRLGHGLQAAGRSEIYRDLPFAAWVGLMSLPQRFATTAETIPAAVPYLAADPARVARWRRTVDALPGAVKVGLVWAGNVGHPEDYRRSVTLPLLAPLFARGDIAFVSLQKDRGEDDAALPGTLLDVSARLRDFDDTAALIEALDLVLTVDTAVAHLAGALGKPVWIMIPKVKDWRWLKEGDTSAWYPTARLFRQPEQGDWPGVIAAVGAALDELLS